MSWEVEFIDEAKRDMRKLDGSQRISVLKETILYSHSVILRPKAEESPQVAALEIPRSARNDG